MTTSKRRTEAWIYIGQDSEPILWGSETEDRGGVCSTHLTIAIELRLYRRQICRPLG